jgi:hypothetical protein
MIGPIISALIQQPRFKPQDLALAYAEDVYSRFLVAPVRRVGADRIAGAKAIASGGLGGFLGFLDANLMRHDYLLGRANAYAFLKRHLLLPDDGANTNPLFDGWSAAQKNKYRFTDPDTGKSYFPIIPLMDSVTEPAAPIWPNPTRLPDGFADAVEGRLDAVFSKAKAQLLPNSWLGKALSAGLWPIWRFHVRGALRDAIVKKFADGLTAQGL